MLRGFSNRNRLATLNWTQNLSKSTERALALDVALSYQQDRMINLPLTIESDLSTRDPFMGFIMEGMDFEYDFDNFPVNQGLIDNIRRNQGRITPIDVTNGSNYFMVDDLRNNAYGLYGRYQNFANTMDGSTWAMGEAGRYTIDDDTRARGQPVQGRPLHRQGDARLAGRPLQPAQVRRRGHPVQHRQLQLPLTVQVLLRRLHRGADPVERASSRTGSTWATWWSWAGCATTGTTPGPAGRSAPTPRATRTPSPGSPPCRASIRPTRPRCSGGTRATAT